MKKAAKVVNPEDRITPGKILLYIVLILVSAFTLIPFVWMISASLKLDREVFTFPMKWIPETPHWENYSVIWTKVPMLTYFKNTAIIAICVTFIQTLTSSFAAYAFAKLNFKGRNVLFLCYIYSDAFHGSLRQTPGYHGPAGLFRLWRVPDAAVLSECPVGSV